MIKPYYEEPGITIYNADCRDVLPQLEPVDLVLTDIPYGEVNREDNGLRNLNKGSADVETISIEKIPTLLIPYGNSFYVWCGTEQVSIIRKIFVCEGLSTRLGVWEKSNPSPMNGEHIWLSGIEVCVFGKRKNAYFGAFCKNTVWKGNSDLKQWHPTQKPIWLFHKLIEASSQLGKTVIDPFMGSGTTLRAAKDLGRKAIGIEIEKKYCDIAISRLQQEVLPLDGNTRQTESRRTMEKMGLNPSTTEEEKLF